MNHCSCTLPYFPLPVFTLKGTERQFPFIIYRLPPTTATVLTFLTATIQFKGKGDHSPTQKRQTQSKKAEKGWIKDVILLPSPKAKTVPRNLLRETLFDKNFVISGLKLKSSASEKELTSSIEKVLSDKMGFVPGSPKFNFVWAVE